VFAAVKAIEHKVATGASFDEELRALRRFVESASSDEASLITTALSTIPETVASSGIASFTALTTRFHASVAPQLRRVAVYPEHGGVLAYLSSIVASTFLFQKEGWAEGDDVVSTIARANFWLEIKDLDQAVREVNSLKGSLPVPLIRLVPIAHRNIAGWPKALASDWLNQARRHLEVKQALEVAEGAATAENLKAV
jgi:mitofilin